MRYLGHTETIPLEERVDNAVKRLHKLTTATKAYVGQSGRGGNTSGRRGGGRRGGYNNYNGGRLKKYNIQGDCSNDYMPSGSSTFGRYNGTGSFGGNNGGGRGNGERTCFICGSTGHQAKQCPKAG